MKSELLESLWNGRYFDYRIQIKNEHFLSFSPNNIPQSSRSQWQHNFPRRRPALPVRRFSCTLPLLLRRKTNRAQRSVPAQAYHRRPSQSPHKSGISCSLLASLLVRDSTRIILYEISYPPRTEPPPSVKIFSPVFSTRRKSNAQTSSPRKNEKYLFPRFDV